MQLLGFIPAAMFCLIDSFSSNVSFAYLMGMVVLVSIIVQIIQDILLTPKIMGDATGLNPAILLLSLSTWGKLLGFLGLIIAIPFTTVLISYYKKFLERLKAGN